MNKKTILHFIAAMAACFAIGCAMAGVVHLYDLTFDTPAPITGGQTIDFSAYGFTLTVPDGYALNDYTTSNFAEGGNALFAGCAYYEGNELYIYCYKNEAGDDLSDYPEQDIVTHYTSAGAVDVRFRTLGERPFICYTVSVLGDEGTETWYTYETWDEGHQLVFETRMSPSAALPILGTIAFVPAADSSTPQ